jgi:hypothetical protein
MTAMTVAIAEVAAESVVVVVEMAEVVAVDMEVVTAQTRPKTPERAVTVLAHAISKSPYGTPEWVLARPPAPARSTSMETSTPTTCGQLSARYPEVDAVYWDRVSAD